LVAWFYSARIETWASAWVPPATGALLTEIRLRACFKKRESRREWARGLQELAEIAASCRPGHLTGRFLKHALSNWNYKCRAYMKTKWLIVVLLVCIKLPGFALSTPIGRDIAFPKDYDPQKAKAIRLVIQHERFKFVSGIVSQWPPNIATRLSFDGDAASLNQFLTALRGIHGMRLRLVLYRGRDDELRRDSPWQLDFSQAHPDELTVYLNLNTKALDFEKMKLPEWPAQ
jgi:hypothetical protein